MNSSTLQLAQRLESSDGSTKVLWNLRDGATIESVILPRSLKARKKILADVPSETPPPSSRFTACVSSQVGCALACDFCLTGKQGWIRNLSRDEIVDQVQELNRIRRITNVVFMGMGEPLQNVDAVTEAIQVFKIDRDLQFSRRKILVSTSGWLPGLKKLEKTGVRLAISLHATENGLRDQIMPINKRYPIESLLLAAREYGHQVRQTVMVEYVLLKGLNDTLGDQERLFQWTQGWDCKVNLIPFNPFELPGLPAGPYERPDFESVKAFQHSLVSRGVTATVRYSGGDDILAACGQLKSDQVSLKRGFRFNPQ